MKSMIVLALALVSMVSAVPDEAQDPAPILNQVPVEDPLPDVDPVPLVDPVPDVNPVPLVDPVPDVDPVPLVDPVPDVNPVPLVDEELEWDPISVLETNHPTFEEDEEEEELYDPMTPEQLDADLRALSEQWDSEEEEPNEEFYDMYEDWMPTPTEVLDLKVPECLRSVEGALEAKVTIPTTLSEVRHSLQSHNQEVHDAQSILYAEPELMDELLEKHPDLVESCTNYRKEVLAAEMTVDCLNAVNKEEDDIADATTDRIRYNQGLEDFKMLSAYHDLLGICNKAVQGRLSTPIGEQISLVTSP